MRRQQIDRQDRARRARPRRGPGIDLDEHARADARAAVIRANATHVTGRAARFLRGTQASCAATVCSTRSDRRPKPVKEGSPCR
jgi:hypothetical protein